MQPGPSPTAVAWLAACSAAPPAAPPGGRSPQTAAALHAAAAARTAARHGGRGTGGTLRVMHSSQGSRAQGYAVGGPCAVGPCAASPPWEGCGSCRPSVCTTAQATGGLWSPRARHSISQNDTTLLQPFCSPWVRTRAPAGTPQLMQCTHSEPTSQIKTQNKQALSEAKGGCRPEDWLAACS